MADVRRFFVEKVKEIQSTIASPEEDREALLKAFSEALDIYKIQGFNDFLSDEAIKTRHKRKKNVERLAEEWSNRTEELLNSEDEWFDYEITRNSYNTATSINLIVEAGGPNTWIDTKKCIITGTDNAGGTVSAPISAEACKIIEEYIITCC